MLLSMMMFMSTFYDMCMPKRSLPTEYRPDRVKRPGGPAYQHNRIPDYIFPEHSPDGFPTLGVLGGVKSTSTGSLILLDSGAVVSITNDKNAFAGTLRPTNEFCVVANGERIEFDGVGPAFGLPTVYYLPSAISTLLSLSDLCDENDFSSAKGGTQIIFTSKVDGSETWKFQLKNRLWVLWEDDAAVNSVFSVQPMDGAKAMLLHRRMGHCSWASLRDMVRQGLVEGLDNVKLSDIPTRAPYCHTCALGKIRRLPFAPVNPHRSTVPGAGWHVDIIVLRTPAITGGRYFLLFTDDATRLWAGYVLKRKRDAHKALRQFHVDIIQYYGKTMVFIKSDRGGEFTSHRFQAALMELGVRQFFVTPHDPASNGAAERQGQTLFGTVRCSLIDSGMPTSFWAYAAFLGIYVRNRIGRIGPDGTRLASPMELYTGVKPTIKKIRVFGSHCTYFEEQPNKLLPRGHAARFLHVADYGYYLWDPASNKLVHRRHVDFRERAAVIPSTDPTVGGEFPPNTTEPIPEDHPLVPNDPRLHLTTEELENEFIGVDDLETDDLITSFHDTGTPDEDDPPTDTGGAFTPPPGAKAYAEIPFQDSHLRETLTNARFTMHEISPPVIANNPPDVRLRGAGHGPRTAEVEDDDVDESKLDEELDDERDTRAEPLSGDVSLPTPSTAGTHHPSLLKELETDLTEAATKTSTTRSGRSKAAGRSNRVQFGVEDQVREIPARKGPYKPVMSEKTLRRTEDGSITSTPRSAPPAAGKPQPSPIALGLEPTPTDTPVKRGRGRPKGSKNKVKNVDLSVPDSVEKPTIPTAGKRGRGRPRGSTKKKILSQPSDEPVAPVAGSHVYSVVTVDSLTSHLVATARVIPTVGPDIEIFDPEIGETLMLRSGRNTLSALEELEDRALVCTSPPILAGVVDPNKLAAMVANGNLPDDTPLTAPKSRREAQTRYDAAEWAKAEEAEFQGLESKKVFSWVRKEDIPRSIKILSTRYVYDYKVNENNEIIKYKARLVVRGFEQREGIEYGDTFSTTASANSVRTVLSIAARERLRLHQFDVEQAFLTADIRDEVIYVQPPEGHARPGEVWRLEKALYGLKQASRLFEEHFAGLLEKTMRLTRLKTDRSIYIMRRSRGSAKEAILIVCVYVDDLIVAYSDEAILNEFKTKLSEQIKIKDVGTLKYCLGMHVEQDSDCSVTITQSGFVNDLLARAGFDDDLHPKKTAAPPSKVLTIRDCPATDAEIREMKQAPFNTYRSIVGSLMYLTGATRPDIAFAVNQLSRYVANPGKPHWECLVHLLRYLAGHRDLGIHYYGRGFQDAIRQKERKLGHWNERDPLPKPHLLSESFGNNLMSYADSDWATDVDTRRSTTGWVCFLNGGPISWRTKRQDIVAASSTEAELYALADCAKQVRWLSMFLEELGFPQPMKPPGRGGKIAEPNSVRNRGPVIFEDNTGCLNISQHDVYEKRTKHVSTKYAFLHDYVQMGYISVVQCGTADQLADSFTKAPPQPLVERMRPMVMGTWALAPSLQG